MAKANVDPAELRRFARDLTRFNSDLETLLVGLQGRLKELERSWADQEQRRFAQEFELTVKTLRRFLDASTQHVTFLAKKAGHVEDYLQQR
ncbi:MAG: WXG100 family type VII secretion target [Planctomycetaceae bacterium]|nr:MAG: WXG100 family type VII secretion target [Planctomycetaceae bacterium]